MSVIYKKKGRLSNSSLNVLEWSTEVTHNSSIAHANLYPTNERAIQFDTKSTIQKSNVYLVLYLYAKLIHFQTLIQI